MYEQYGDDFASRLKGAFTIAIWDQKERKLLLTNDRLGLYPLYYAQTVSGLIFASGVRALFADPELPRDTDPIAIAQRSHLVESSETLATGSSLHLFKRYGEYPTLLARGIR